MSAQAPVFPRAYKYMDQEDRDGEMKVLALGLSRTGTLSLYDALGQLGYDAYHMAECVLDYQNDSLVNWKVAINAKYHKMGPKWKGKNFDRMLWRYDAVVGLPGNLFVEELMDAYPTAKIILTTRTPSSWSQSVQKSLYVILNMKRWWFLELTDRPLMTHYIQILQSELQRVTGNMWWDVPRYEDGMAEHNERVRDAAKARGRKVLEFKAEDGWAPLCKFLGDDVPKDMPYPHMNEPAWLLRQHQTLFWQRMQAVLLIVLLWMLPAAFAFWSGGYVRNWIGPIIGLKPPTRAV